MRELDAAGVVPSSIFMTRVVRLGMHSGLVCGWLACWLSSGFALGAQGLVIEETFLTVEIRSETYSLEALVVKELGNGPKLPIALITHGQARDFEQREKLTARAHLRTAREFARRGWLAVVVVRRGFGRSGGKHPYVLPGCRNGDYAASLDAQTDDLEAAIKVVSRRNDADGTQVVALGMSVGGAAVLNLAARQPEGLKAAINVSGGIRTAPRGEPSQETCKPEDLVTFFAALGRRSRLPTLWLYAENDSVFPAEYARQLHEAYVGEGGRTEFHMFDAIGTEGHDMFGHPDGMLRWIPVLDRFLLARRLKTFDPNPVEASLRQLSLGPSARQAIIRYKGRPTEKALAVSRSNRIVYTQFSGGDLEETERLALEKCTEKAQEPCRIVIRNFQLAEEPEARPAGLN